MVYSRKNTIVLGVTGSIGSGKSFACDTLSKLPSTALMSSDRTVHEIYNNDINTAKEIAKYFPESVNGEHKIDRKILGDIIFRNHEQKAVLESIIFPKLADQRDNFIRNSIKNKTRLAILEVPLLFENNIHLECDYVLTIYCRKALQKQRVLSRPNMTEEKFFNILSSQMPPYEKIKYSDFSINSGLNKANTVRELRKLYQVITSY